MAMGWLLLRAKVAALHWAKLPASLSPHLQLVLANASQASF